MSKRASGRKRGPIRTKRGLKYRQNSIRRMPITFSMEPLEARCLLSVTELLSTSPDLDTQSSFVAEQSVERPASLIAASETLVAAPAAEPRAASVFATGQVLDVSNTWQAVTLPTGYNSMVVVLTANYDQTSVPLVPRMRIVSGNSFEVRVDRADGSSEEVAGVALHYVVVEEGVYTSAEHGITMEAVTYTSTVTDGRGSWSGESRGYSNSYDSPIVVGQVMSYNDSRFSSFWAHDGSRYDVPDSTNLSVGKHVGEDPDNSRDEETVGYLVVEAGDHALSSMHIVAGMGSDIVRGVDTNPPYTYALSGLTSPSTAILSSAGMDGGDGGRPILYGPDPVTPTSINLAIDEDQTRDSERRHTTEQVAYLVFESVNQAPTAIALDNQSVSENIPGAVVGTLQVTDPDEGDTHTFTVSDPRFVVDGDQLKLTDDTALDYETEPSVDLTVTVYDSGSPPLSYSQQFNIAVEDVAESSLSGTVFNDVDGNGEQGTGETGLSNWTLYLDSNSNSQLDTDEVSTLSDSNGLYVFDDLSAGDYRVGQVVPDGWQQTTPAISSQSTSRIVNGTPTSDFSSVGMLGAWGSDFCSGTLISPTFVLTAAHCAEGVGDTEGNFTVEGQTYTTSRVYVHPDWNDFVFGTDGANDIALYELSTSVTGATPSPIFTGTPQVGDELTLVGFGAGGDGNTGHNGDYGIKRVGTTPIDQVSSTLIHWSFDNNSESNTAPGDSGGPAFLLVDGVYEVAGVTSGGDRFDAGIGDNSYDTRVDAYQDWIGQLTGGGGTPSAGFYDVTLVAGQNLTGLDFGNQQEGGNPNPNPESGYSIEVVFTDNTMTTSQQAVFNAAAERWSEIIVGDVPAVDVPGIGLIDDLMIYASAPIIDGVGGILGQAAPTSFRDSWLPSNGFMQFDRDDLDDMESGGVLIDLILHEMGHVIGIGTIWSVKGLLQDAGGDDPRFTGEAATQAYNEIFGNAESSVPVANTGGPGTSDAHWREEVFNNELMTGYLNMGGNPLSRVTAASLADLGYTVNLDAADDYSPSFALEAVNSFAFPKSSEETIYYSQLYPGAVVHNGQTLAEAPEGRSSGLQLVPPEILDDSSTFGVSTQRLIRPANEPQWTAFDNMTRHAIRGDRSVVSDELVESTLLPQMHWRNERAVDTIMEDLCGAGDSPKLFLSITENPETAWNGPAGLG